MGFKEKIKEMWEKEDELCPNCNQVTKRYGGITKQSLSRLCKFKVNTNEFVLTFLIIGIVLIGLVYMHETKTCRTWVNEQQPMFNGTLEQCQIFCSSKCTLIHNQDKKEELNLSGINFTTIK